MKLQQLGSTDLWISPLGLGTVKLGRDQAVKYPETFAIPDDKAATSLLDLAQALGINLLDTAPAYGNSEERLGGLLKGRRHDWVISTKVGEEFFQGKSSFDFSREHIRFSVERSLQRLKTDYLDIVLVHSDGHDVEIIQKFGVFDVLNDLKRAGHLRAFGMSTKTREGGLLTVEKADVVMTTYQQDVADDLVILEKAKDLKKGVLIKKAFASGHALQNQQPQTLENQLRFIFNHPAVATVIVGTINLEHLKQNVAAVKNIFKSKE